MLSGAWWHPGDDALRRVDPRLVDPVDFLDPMRRTSLAEEIHEWPSDLWETFKFFRDGQPLRDLPWINADRSILIAVNRIPGDDVAIALNYVSAPVGPRVVASHYRDDMHHEWFEVSRSFEDFAHAIEVIGAD